MGPSTVSHLFFADDSILFFFWATRWKITKVREIIAKYEAVSGQRINLEKSEIITSGNMSEEKREELGQQFGAKPVVQYAKYLGLPMIIGRSKKVVFQTVMERINTQLKGWNEKSLTKVGVQAIPNYVMSCFLFPISLCEEIEKAVAHFYWGATRHELGEDF